LQRWKEDKVKLIIKACMAALASMALVGVSSAMAETTALCKAAESTCTSGNLIEHVHEVTLTGKKAKLLSNLGAIECDVLFLGDVKTNGLIGTSLLIEGHFKYSSCNLGCTVAEPAGAISKLTVEKVASETAKVTGVGEIELNCNLINFHCTYNHEGLVATAKGANASNAEMPNGEAFLSEQEMHAVKGAACPSTVKLDINTGPLEKTFIVSSAMAETTALCKAAEGTCAEASLIKNVKEVTLTGKKAKFLSSLGNIECEVSLEGEVTTAGLLGGPLLIEGHFKYSSCNLGCTVAEPAGAISKLTVEKVASETAKVTGVGEIELNCNLINFHCTYNHEGLVATAKGANASNAEMPNGEAFLSEQEMHAVKGAACPSTVKLDINTGPAETKVFISS
jgi:hypothetical protein